MAPITASAPKLTGATIELREPSLPVKLLTAGTAACVADLITFPLDTAKVRLQVYYITILYTTTSYDQCRQAHFYDLVYPKIPYEYCM